MTSKKSLSLSELIALVWRTNTMDYFRRLGGSGQYDGFENWHALGLTILSSLKVNRFAEDKDIERCLKILPSDISRCDDLFLKISSDFARKQEHLSLESREREMNEILDIWARLTSTERGFRFSDFDLALRSLLSEATLERRLE